MSEVSTEIYIVKHGLSLMRFTNAAVVAASIINKYQFITVADLEPAVRRSCNTCILSLHYKEE